MKKYTIWIALFAIPLLYELLRRTHWPWPNALMAFALHWILAFTVLAWANISLDGPEDIGLRRVIPGFLCFALIIAVYGSGLIVWFGSQPLADWQYAQMTDLGRWGVILTGISAGFCEELTYRGYMMTSLKRSGQPVWLAMTLSTLSFVFFHGLIPVPFIVAFFIIGMIFAAIYQRTSILWVTIYIHGLWDVTVLLVPMGSGTP